MVRVLVSHAFLALFLQTPSENRITIKNIHVPISKFCQSSAVVSFLLPTDAVKQYGVILYKELQIILFIPLNHDLSIREQYDWHMMFTWC